MYGIVGYVGENQAYPFLVQGLKRLEYRGYDSAGLAISGTELQVHKCKGRVADLESHVQSKDVNGTVGIAHTRWATHGEPNDRNAHPHRSMKGNFALVHNGIIENYAELKIDLTRNGFEFQSDTDTEVLVNLIEFLPQRRRDGGRNGDPAGIVQGCGRIWNRGVVWKKRSS